MPRAPKLDPKTAALLAERAKAQADAERWYRRMKRAMNRLEKARRLIARIDKRIDNYRPAAPKETVTT